MSGIRGVVDLHHHILPGVDDGAPDLETAMQLAALAVAEGIDTIVATPHTLDGVYDVPRAAALDAHARLTTALAAAGITLQIRVAAEVRMHEGINELLAAAPDVTLDGHGRYLLLELPHDSVPPALPELLFRLRARGTTPVIAHPERYLAVRKNPRIVATWLELGARLQLTTGSVTGAFGEPIRRCANELLRAGAVHIMATDAHSPRKRPPIVQAAFEAASAIVGEDGARTLLVDNPARVHAGAPASTVLPVPAHKRRGLFAALRR
jgi:protein-tyrosine phosphatase